MRAGIIFLLAIWAVLFAPGAVFAQTQSEEITLSTYYPAPFGDYDDLYANNLIAGRQIIGNVDVNGDGHPSTRDDIALVNNGNLLVQGSVAIGRAVPRAPLEVYNSGNFQAIFSGAYDGMVILEDRGGTANRNMKFVGAVGDDFWIGNANTVSSYTNYFTIRYGGNVGIGTTAPGARLEIQNASDTTTLYAGGGLQNRTLRLWNRSNTAGSYASLELANTSNGVGAALVAIKENALDNSSTTMAFLTSKSSGYVSEAMRITSAGNVGIGTTSPAQRLDVNGNANISGDLSVGGTLQSIAANGYQKLPGGLIIQWGLGTSTIDGSQNFTFPLAFPNTCFGVQTTITTANSQYQLPVASISTAGFTINREDAIDGNRPFYWFAIGH